MAESGITIKVTLDSSQVQQGLTPLNNLSAAFSTLDAKLKQTAAASTSASAQMATGMQQLSQSVVRQVAVQGNFNKVLLQTGQAAGVATKQLQQLPVVLTRTQQVMSTMSGAFGKFSGVLSGIAIGGLAALGAAAIKLGKEIFDASLQMDQMARSLEAVTGSQRIAAQEMEFVRDLATQTGVGLDTLTQQWAGLFAATAQTAGRLTEARNIFSAIIETATRMGKSTEQVGLALYGFTQIAGGATLQLQDFNQMIDALPGLFPALAREFGVTQQRLRDMTSAGEVFVDDLLPKMDRAIRSLASGTGPIVSLRAEIGRLGNAWLEFMAALGDLGPVQAMGLALRGLTGIVQGLAAAARDAKGAIFGLSEAKIVQNSMQQLELQINETRKSIDNLKQASTTGAGGLINRMLGMGEPAAKLAELEAHLDQLNRAYLALGQSATLYAGKAALTPEETARQKEIEGLKEAGKAYTTLNKEVMQLKQTRDALKSTDVEKLLVLGLDPMLQDFEQRRAGLLKRVEDDLQKAQDKLMGIDRKANERAVNEAAQSATERAKAVVDRLAAQLKQEEALLERSYDQRRQEAARIASEALTRDPRAVFQIEKTLADERLKIAREEAQALETLRLAELDKRVKAQEEAIRADMAAAGKHTSQRIKGEEALTTLLKDAEAERAEIKKNTGEGNAATDKKTLDEQMRSAKELVKITEETEQARLDARIDLIDDQIALVEAQVAGEVLTYSQGQAQIKVLQDQRLAFTRQMYIQEAEVAIQRIQREVEDTTLAMAQIQKIREGLANDLKALDVRQQTDTQQFLNKQRTEFQRFTDFVADGLAGMFKGLLDGTLNAAEAFRRLFIQTIATLAAQVATMTIVVPIVTQFLGGLGPGGQGAMNVIGQALGIPGLGAVTGGAGAGGAGGGGILDLLGLGALGTQLSGLLGPQGLLSTAVEFISDKFISVGSQISTFFGGPALARNVSGVTLGGAVPVNPMMALGGLAGLGGGVFSALMARNMGGRVGGAVGAAGGAAALATGLLPTIMPAVLGPIGLAVAALAPLLGTMLGDMFKAKGPRLVISQLQGLGVAFEEGALRLTGDLTSGLLRRERLPMDVTGFQRQMEDNITGVVKGMVDVINAVAQDSGTLLGSTRDALQEALQNAMKVNTSSAKNFERDIQEQGRFLTTQISSFFLRPLNEAFRQLESADLEDQLNELPGTVQGMVQVFKQMNEQLDSLAKVENTDVLRQLSSVRNRVEDFGNALADTARVISTDIVDQIAAMVAAPMPDSREAMEALDMTIAERITELNQMMTASLRAFTALQATAGTLRGAGLEAGGVEDQLTRLTNVILVESGRMATAIVTQSLGELSVSLDRLLVQPIEIQTMTIQGAFTSAMGALTALGNEWRRLSEVGLETDRFSQAFDQLLGGILDTAVRVVSNAWDPTQFDAFLGVLVAIPEAVAALNPRIKELRDLGLAFAAVVGPNTQRIEALEAAMRTPAETMALMQDRMDALRQAIAKAGTAVEQVLPLYDQLSQAVVARAEAEIAMVQAIGEEIDKTTGLIEEAAGKIEETMALMERIEQIDLERLGTVAQRAAIEARIAAAPPEMDISELINLYERQLAVLGEMRQILESAIDSITQTLRAQGSLETQIVALSADIASAVAQVNASGTPESLAELTTLLQSQLALVQQLIGMIEAGIKSIDDTLLSLLDPTEQAAALAEDITRLLAEINADPSTEHLLELVDVTKQALSVQQQISASLRESLRAARETILGAVSPAEQLRLIKEEMAPLMERVAAGTATPEDLNRLVELTRKQLEVGEPIRASIEERRREIAALMEKVAAGTATPEELRQLVALNEGLLQLGEETDLLDIQQEAVDNLKRLEPILNEQLAASESMEEQLVNLLEDVRTVLETRLDEAHLLEQQTLDQLIAVKEIMDAMLVEVTNAEDATVAALQAQYTLLETQLIALWGLKGALDDQLAALGEQLKLQYGTMVIDDIIRQIQEGAAAELRAINAGLAALFASQEVVKNIMLNPGGSPVEQAQTHYLSQTAANTGKLNEPMQLQEPVGIDEPLDVRIVYMQASYQKGGLVGRASGEHYAQRGLVPVMLEPGEVQFSGPLTRRQEAAISAMNTAFPRFGGEAMQVPGTGAGDIVPALLPQGSGVLNREAAAAIGLQRGSVMPAGGALPWLPHVTSPPRFYQQGGSVPMAPGPTTVTIHVDLRGSQFSKNITLEEFKALMETLQRRRL